MTINRFVSADDNISTIRDQYPEGLHFVVGDVHGEARTLQNLMKKIAFDPEKDHIYFVGDYNAGGSPKAVLEYFSLYYQEDFAKPGFHLIRGNHEWELGPIYPLENLPDILVYRGEQMNYFIAHAGMVASAFRLIAGDMEKNPEQELYAYKLDDACVREDAPLRQIIWSRRGLYSQKSRWKMWPRTEDLFRYRACIIHGHTPYCYFMNDRFGYGDYSLFWENQKIWFSEDLCSFDIDSNVKGRVECGETYRGLACVCLEALDEISEANNGYLTISAIRAAPNFVFSVPLEPRWYYEQRGDISRVLEARPRMKRILLDWEENPVLAEESEETNQL